LVWTEKADEDKDEDESESHHAPAAVGRYAVVYKRIIGATGYDVRHEPRGVEKGSRLLASVVRSVDKAKAIAQGDHDAGRDRAE
jgi:hypothetical protein